MSRKWERINPPDIIGIDRGFGGRPLVLDGDPYMHVVGVDHIPSNDNYATDYGCKGGVHRVTLEMEQEDTQVRFVFGFHKGFTYLYVEVSRGIDGAAT